MSQNNARNGWRGGMLLAGFRRSSMGRPRKQEIELSEAERDSLSALVRSRTAPHGLVRWAQIVLASADASRHRKATIPIEAVIQQNASVAVGEQRTAGPPSRRSAARTAPRPHRRTRPRPAPRAAGRRRRAPVLSAPRASRSAAPSAPPPAAPAPFAAPTPSLNQSHHNGRLFQRSVKAGGNRAVERHLHTFRPISFQIPANPDTTLPYIQLDNLNASLFPPNE